MNSATYLTTEELSFRIKHDVRTIRERLIDSALIEGVHYFRPFGGRKILFIWEQIEQDMQNARRSPQRVLGGIRMANGGVLHG